MVLKQKLDYHYKAFDKTKISPDPLQFLHMFSNEKDIEAIGFIASIFAYGNVNQIINTLNKIIEITANKPYKFIAGYYSGKYSYKLIDLKHRFYTGDDISLLFYILSDVYHEYGSIKNLFYTFYRKQGDIKNSLIKFSDYFINYAMRIKGGNINPGFNFMFPSPELGSACKRMNLFLRWMVRKDGLDFGFWGEIPASKLVIPVDTHVARICQNLKLTKRKNISWAMAEEITENLRKFDPDDPVKYDFAICHIGMRKMNF